MTESAEGFPLYITTNDTWTQHILENFNDFLIDHAACEKKASGMAISMISHYPDRRKLVDAMADLAIEELVHYKEVIKVIHERGLTLAADEKDEYINRLENIYAQAKKLILWID